MPWIKAWTVHAARNAGHRAFLRPEDFDHALRVANEAAAKEPDAPVAFGQPRGPRTLAKMRRDAIGHVLVAHGFLRIRRRPITLRELMRPTARIGQGYTGHHARQAIRSTA